jgi:hypothetical protein
MNRYRLAYLVHLSVLALVLALAATAAAKDDQTTVLAGYEKATVTDAAPFTIDTTRAMQARNHLFPPYEPVIVVPEVAHVPFTGRRGLQFVAEQDPAREMFDRWGGASQAFPGPSISGLTPGDPNLSVGPNHVVCTINGQIAFYTKAGAPTFSVSPNAFFASLGSYSLVFDCRTVYDRYAGRYWIMYSAYSSGNQGYWLVALSDDADPNGTWALWELDASKNGNTHVNMWADYPGLGYNENALVLTANMYGTYSGGKVRVALKNQFLAGSPTITYTDFWNISEPSGGQAWSLQPARTVGFSHMPYFCNVSGNNRANVFGIQNVTTSPSLVSRAVTIPTFNGSVPDAEQMGGSVELWCIDARIFDVHARDNLITFNHHVNVSSRCACQWFEIDATGMPSSASLVQSGKFTASNRDIYFGTVVTNGSGHMAAGLGRSGSAEYISIYSAGRLATDPLGSFAAQTLVLAGTRYYTGEGGNPVRWGDYSGLVVDPVDDSTFWGFKMIPDPGGNYWDTEVYTVTVGLPATLTGTVNLAQWVASPAGLSATLEFRSPGTTTVLHKYQVTLDSSGQFALPAVMIGTFDVGIKFSHWLREVIPSLPIGQGANVVTFNLVNGDATQDNAVDLGDLNAVLTRFGTGNPSVDLDGGGLVDLPDLNIVLTSFGAVGDP